jgi:type I restriction enzyme M protein
MAKNNNSTQEEHLEKQLWKAADKLRKNIDAAEYKHIVMGLIFLKYISDAFEGLYQKLQQGEGDYAGADPEDRDEYKAENIFFVPAIARWSYLYTPRSVVQLLVEMLEPYNGRVFDPCCGSGGMFVQSEKFVEDHQGKVNDISIYGQESNQTTWRLCKMNLAIRSIDSSQVKWNNEGSFLNDTHKDLKADYVIANPPFNDSDWSGDLLRKDGRWEYGVPPAGNANYAWIQHFLYHLNQSGRAGFVLAKGSLTSKTSGEGDIRKELVEARLVDCTVNLPAKLFLNTQIPACLWFLSRNKANGKYRNRTDEILFIDARNIGHLINRRTREFSSEDIRNVADTYHNWRNPDGDYEDVKGFCKSASIERVRELDYVVTPRRYVGLPVEEDDFDFNERFTRLKAEFEEQLKEEAGLNSQILENLSKIKMEGEK